MATLTPRQRSHARSLRRDDTSTEQRLWTALRYRRLNGVKFVRQLPIGPYIADFACRAAKLIVEVDGATHSAEEEIAHDMARTAYLREHGWRVMRVWSDDVVRNLDDVLDEILRQCSTP